MLYCEDMDINSPVIEMVIVSLIFGVRSVSALSERAILDLAAHVTEDNPRLAGEFTVLELNSPSPLRGHFGVAFRVEFDGAALPERPPPFGGDWRPSHMTPMLRQLILRAAREASRHIFVPFWDIQVLGHVC